MASHFHDWIDFPCYQNEVAHLRGFGGQKIQTGRDLKIFMGRFFLHLVYKCVNSVLGRPS